MKVTRKISVTIGFSETEVDDLLAILRAAQVGLARERAALDDDEHNAVMAITQQIEMAKYLSECLQGR